MGYSYIIIEELYQNGSQTYSVSDCKLGDTPVAKGDKFNINQCPKNDFEKKKAEDSLYVDNMKSDVCLGLYGTQYCIHY